MSIIKQISIFNGENWDSPADIGANAENIDFTYSTGVTASLNTILPAKALTQSRIVATDSNGKLTTTGINSNTFNTMFNGASTGKGSFQSQINTLDTNSIKKGILPTSITNITDLSDGIYTFTSAEVKSLSNWPVDFPPNDGRKLFVNTANTKYKYYELHGYSGDVRIGTSNANENIIKWRNINNSKQYIGSSFFNSDYGTIFDSPNESYITLSDKIMTIGIRMTITSEYSGWDRTLITIQNVPFFSSEVLKTFYQVRDFGSSVGRGAIFYNTSEKQLKLSVGKQLKVNDVVYIYDTFIFPPE